MIFLAPTVWEHFRAFWDTMDTKHFSIQIRPRIGLTGEGTFVSGVQRTLRRPLVSGLVSSDVSCLVSIPVSIRASNAAFSTKQFAAPGGIWRLIGALVSTFRLTAPAK
jgi:hypothetical protein